MTNQAGTIQVGRVVYERQQDGSLVPIAEAGSVSLNGEARSMTDLLADPPAVTPRLLEPALIVEKGITVLAAPTKVGKTTFWLHVAKALTEGSTLWGRFTAPRAVPVLMIQLELSEAILYERLRILRDELGWSDEAAARFFLRCERSIQLDRRDGPAKVAAMIEGCSERPAVVILDSYNAAVMGDPDKSGEARRALHGLREIQERTGIAWAVTAEIRKPPAGGHLRYSVDDLKGSNDVAYDADAVLMFRPTDAARRRLSVRFSAMRHAVDEPPEGLVLVRRGLTFELTEAAAGDDIEAGVEAVLRKHLDANGDRTWRGCARAVRDASIKTSNEVITTVRNRVLARLSPPKDRSS
jgi:hypothetical protein